MLFKNPYMVLIECCRIAWKKAIISTCKQKHANNHIASMHTIYRAVLPLAGPPREFDLALNGWLLMKCKIQVVGSVIFDRCELPCFLWIWQLKFSSKDSHVSDQWPTITPIRTVSTTALQIYTDMCGSLKWECRIVHCIRMLGRIMQTGERRKSANSVTHSRKTDHC